jgi:pimeloyl-ACP methyl ester carboxylesterase
MSLGGYLAARAAAFEPRLAALILFNGVFDVYDSVITEVPRPFRSMFRRQARLVNAMLKIVMSLDVSKRWALTNGMWTGGFSSPADYFHANRRYTLEGIANQISCPTLVCDAEQDHFFDDARSVFRALSCPKEYVLFTSEEGAEEHCQVGAMSLFHQHIFDWLDEVIEDHMITCDAFRSSRVLRFRRREQPPSVRTEGAILRGMGCACHA